MHLRIQSHIKNKHAHFYCKKCNTVICLDNVPVEEPQVPQGFEANETEVIIKGVCPICKKINVRVV